MIDQSEYAGGLCLISHALCLSGIHGHWLFAEHSLASFKSCQGNLHMRRRRRDHAYEIDILALNQLAPIGSDVFDAKLFGDALRMFTMPARDRHHTRAFAVKEAWYLRGAGKAGAYNSNPDS